MRHRRRGVSRFSALDRLDGGAGPRHAERMTENRFAVPLEEFEARSRVPVVDQVEVQPELRHPPAGWAADGLPYADGGGGDADGD